MRTNSSPAVSRGVSSLIALVVTILLLAQPGAAQVVEQQWAARLDGPPHLRDEANAVTTDAQGNTLVTGSVCISAEGPQADFGNPCGKRQALTTKYNPNGQQLWRAWLGSPVGVAHGRAITTDQAGNVYVSAEFWLAQFISEIVTMKYNPDGARQWISFYKRNGEGGPVAIAVDSAGNTYVTGYLSDQGQSTHHPWKTIKYGPSGAILWIATMDSERVHDRPAGLVVDGQGNVYVTGLAFDGGQTAEAITVKYGPDGTQLWLDSFFPGTNFVKDFRNTGIALGTDGNIYVTGTGSTSENEPNPSVVSSAHVIKYSPAGARIWAIQHRSAGASQTSAAAIAVDRQGNSYVVGRSVFPSGTSYATMKFDSAGGLSWERFYPTPGSAPFSTLGIVLNSFADVYVAVTGRNPVAGSTNDITTIKYNAHGNERWVVNYDGPAFGDDQATGIAIRGGGIFVIGSGTGTNTNFDWATIKYVQDGTSLAPESLTFGPQAIGTTSAPQVLTVTNIAETPLHLTEIAANGDFSQTNDCPATLPAEGNCTIQVTFTPASAGAKEGTVTVSSNWAGSPQVAELSGTGQ